MADDFHPLCSLNFNSWVPPNGGHINCKVHGQHTLAGAGKIAESPPAQDVRGLGDVIDKTFGGLR